ncbi:5-carboxymethyl-2-hydroxymuconate Delta-isomerase [Streptomyces sp. NPDC054961]
MPQITVDYSARLSDAFDRRGFALALHPVTAELVETTVEHCKTRFRCLEEVYVGDGSPEHALIHVQVGLLAGRTEAVKAELADAVLALLRTYASTGASGPGAVVHVSVDVNDLGASYRKYIEG